MPAVILYLCATQTVKGKGGLVVARLGASGRVWARLGASGRVWARLAMTWRDPCPPWSPTLHAGEELAISC